MGLADALIPGVASNAAALGSRKQLKFKEFTSSGSFVIGANGDATTSATMLNVILVGGGGGGGCGSVTANGAGTVTVTVGGAGGGGEVGKFSIPALSLIGGSASGTVTVTIGAGGVAGSGANGGTAAVGGDSAFGNYQVFGGGRGASSIMNNNVESGATSITGQNVLRFTQGAARRSDSSGTATQHKFSGTGGGGGGVPWRMATPSDLTESTNWYTWGEQNGKRAGGTAAAGISPDSYTPVAYALTSLNNATYTPGGRGGASSFSTAVGDGWYGRGGDGDSGLGGGGAGGVVSTTGTSIATVLVLNSSYWANDYNQSRFYHRDGGGRGAIITAATTANYIAATSGAANTGGGGGAGAAWATATTVYNSVSAGGSGAAGYCLVYWWE